jgi:hypothetical protein
MNPEDFRICTDWYFPYTQEELNRFRGEIPLEPKPIATCTNLIVARGPGYIGLKWEKDK